MLLYLLRHAHAVDGHDDFARPLSAKGRAQVVALAEFLARTDAFSPVEVWHSPLIRARETAVQLASGLRLHSRLIETEGLRPEDDIGIIADRLASGPTSLALVGHDPHLTALASFLIAGDPVPPVVVFDKCTLLALEGPVNHWAVRWQIPPELLA